MHKKLFLAGLLLAFALRSTGQCSFPTGMSNGACTGTTLTDGTSINSGQTYSYSGPATSFNNVTVNSGGILQICGTLTINNLTMNGGDVVIMGGGSLTLSGGFQLNAAPPVKTITNYGTLIVNNAAHINGGNAVINYGSLIFNTDVTIQGSGAMLVNASTGATLNIVSHALNLNNGVVNLGNFTTGSLTANSGASICMGPGAAFNTSTYSNGQANLITVSPSGSPACFHFTSSGTNNAVLTGSTGLTVCQGPGAMASGAGFGSATVIPNCAACPSVTLPVVLTDFAASIQGANCLLSWTTAMEDQVSGFAIEQSTDGIHFSEVGFVAANGSPSTYQYPYTLGGSSYFRLRVQNESGSESYSKVLYVAMAPQGGERIWVAPNPVYGDQLAVHIISAAAADGQVVINGISGEVLVKLSMHLNAGQQDISIGTSSIPAGAYTISFIGSKGRIGPAKWIKLP